MCLSRMQQVAARCTSQFVCPPTAACPLLLNVLQTSTEVFFRKAKFWDGAGKDAPPAFHVDGVQYLHVKVREQQPGAVFCRRTSAHPGRWINNVLVGNNVPVPLHPASPACLLTPPAGPPPAGGRAVLGGGDARQCVPLPRHRAAHAPLLDLPRLLWLRVRGGGRAGFCSTHSSFCVPAGRLGVQQMPCGFQPSDLPGCRPRRLLPCPLLGR